MTISKNALKFASGVAVICTAAVIQAFGQASPPPLPPLAPPTPARQPSVAVQPPSPPGMPNPRQIFLAPAAQNPNPLAASAVTPSPSATPPPVLPTPVVSAPVTVQQPQPSNPGAIVWDSEQKEYKAKYGEANATFIFYFTNISSSEVVITSVRPSCGCTTAKLPPTPWHIEPGATNQIDLNVNLAGKSGTVVKSVTVDSTAGVKSLILRVDIPTTPPTNAPVASFAGVRSEAERAANMQSALADRQAIFKGDCASCHVKPTEGKMGKDLFVASCGICHEAEHRATMVPDLKAMVRPNNEAYWKGMITAGKPGTLMPAFAQKEGGNLTEEQINSLVQYLVQNMPNTQPVATAPKSAAAATPAGSPNVSVAPLPKAN